MTTVTVITPTLAARTHLLADAIQSVANQTHKVSEHLISVDLEKKGPSAVRNKLIDNVTTEWIQFLDDDDILYPNHVELLMANAYGADVVYGWCNQSGRDPWIGNEYFSESSLRERNFIPVTALVRTSMVKEVGGFPDQDKCEDHGLWLRILNHNGKFQCVPEITWEYRYHGGNRTWHEV